MPFVQKIIVSAVIGLGLFTSACTPLVVPAQERSVGRAIDDFSIQTRLSRNLHRSSDRDYRDLEIEVVEGRVLMLGRVHSEEIRLEAKRVAHATNGVDEVIDEIEVSEEGVGILRPRDTWISNRVRGRLLGDSAIREVNYHVETLDGTVYLFGIAQSEEEVNRATGHARTLRGVDRVISHMRVKVQRPDLPGQDT